MYEEFKIHLPVLRAYKDEKTGDMMFEGIASSTSVDSHETVFNEECQNGFMSDILDGISRGEPVELESEHNGEDEPFNILGPVISAEIIDDNKLRIVGRLDPDNSKAVYYFKKMTVKDPITKRVKQFGLSINGAVVKAHYEHNKELNKTIRVFDRVILKRVGIVRKPSNPDSWIEKLIRSVEWEQVETKERSTQMEKDTEVKDTVVEEAETRSEAGDTPDAVADDKVSEATEETRSSEATQEHSSDAATDSDSSSEASTDSETRVDSSNEDDGAAKEELTRASYWTSNDLLNAMSATVASIVTLENLCEYDCDELNVGMTEEAIMVAKDLFSKLQTILGDHVSGKSEMEHEMAELADMSSSMPQERAVDAEGMSDSMHEDLSEKVTDACGNGSEKRSESEKPSKEGLVSEIMGAVAQFLDFDFTEKMERKFNEVLDEQIGKLKEGNEELVRKLELQEKSNSELVARLKAIEESPVSRPGMQLTGEEVSRKADNFKTKREENLARAKAKNDASEVMQFYLFKTYLGNGEFAFEG